MSKVLDIGGNVEHCGAYSNILGVSGKPHGFRYKQDWLDQPQIMDNNQII